jgi:hypothetical protein
MRKLCKHHILTGITFILIVAGSGGQSWAQGPDTPTGGVAGLQQRIDFGNSYIMGQSIKSGAVYLLHRKQSAIKSMLQYREDYRKEILEDFTIQDLRVNGPGTNGRNPAVSQPSAAKN